MVYGRYMYSIHGFYKLWCGAFVILSWKKWGFLYIGATRVRHFIVRGMIYIYI
jgi:hypothetical protein